MYVCMLVENPLCDPVMLVVFDVFLPLSSNPLPPLPMVVPFAGMVIGWTQMSYGQRVRTPVSSTLTGMCANLLYACIYMYLCMCVPLHVAYVCTMGMVYKNMHALISLLSVM